MSDFEKIYSEYYDAVFRYIMSVCKNREVAEEVTQEAFFKALKRIDTFKGECKLSVWLCQIAKNIYYTEFKRIRKQIEFPAEMVSEDDGIESKIFDKETSFELHRLLHNLKEPYKEVFWMRVFGELSFGEIGYILEKSESWARVTYHRAKVKIKEGLN